MPEDRNEPDDEPRLEWPFNKPTAFHCPICLHEYERKQLTKHHLVPKSRKGTETVLVCKPCHKQIHAIFDEKELERRFNTIESLVESEEFLPWVNWIRKRKPTSHIHVTRSGRRKRK
ncbi:MAG: HNH endonuclease [Planctomycetaceae bacterium]